MIEWIINQQGVLSISLILLIASERLLSRKIGAKLAYKFWLFVPLILLCNNIPKQIATVPIESVSHYVVSTNFASEPTESNWLLMVWLIGFAAILIFVVTNYIQLSRSLTRHQRIADIECYSSQLVNSPIVLGVLSPKILLPYDFQQLFCRQQQKMIIEHEKVHIRHGDHFWNALAFVFLVVFWFNPLVWVGVISFRVSQELACDSQVLKSKSKHQKLLYAKALLRSVEQRSLEKSLLPTFGDKNTLVKRLEQMKRPVENRRHLIVIIFLTITALSANTLLAGLTIEPAKNILINELNPSKRVEPHYPTSAINNKQEGSVILKFDITPQGKTNNIEVVQSFPQGVFDASAIDALSNWEYKSHLVEGANKSLKGAFVQLDFRLYRRGG